MTAPQSRIKAGTAVVMLESWLGLLPPKFSPDDSCLTILWLLSSSCHTMMVFLLQKCQAVYRNSAKSFEYFLYILNSKGILNGISEFRWQAC